METSQFRLLYNFRLLCHRDVWVGPNEYRAQRALSQHRRAVRRRQMRRSPRLHVACRRSTAEPASALRPPCAHPAPSPLTQHSLPRPRPCAPRCSRPCGLVSAWRAMRLPYTAARQPSAAGKAGNARVVAPLGLLETRLGLSVSRLVPLSFSALFRRSSRRNLGLFRLQRLNGFMTNLRFHIINSQLSRPRRTRVAKSGEFRPSRTNFCKLKESHSSRNS